MARGKLFEYAVLYHPKPSKDQNDRGETPKVGTPNRAEGGAGFRSGSGSDSGIEGTSRDASGSARRH